MKNLKNKFKNGVILSSLLLIACTSNDAFFQYNTIAPEGWNKDSLCVFDIPISDENSTYNVYVNVRNRGEYPYQNLWLFLQKMSPDSVILNDSIELYLADQRGKWLGSGIGSVLEMPVLYQQNVKFPTKGKYQYKIGHGMRDTVLMGINDIGMRVEKVGSSR
ncbi:MAG: gliding motility lipoprotein GldH [Paludibacter sp.]|nr:gliding motility lipoprotein GldH [Paludibacter sp.]